MTDLVKDRAAIESFLEDSTFDSRSDRSERADFIPDKVAKDCSSWTEWDCSRFETDWRWDWVSSSIFEAFSWLMLVISASNLELRSDVVSALAASTTSLKCIV